MTLREGRNLATIVAIVALLALPGCANFEHTGMSVGGSYQVAPGFTVNTNQYFKKKKE